MKARLIGAVLGVVFGVSVVLGGWVYVNGSLPVTAADSVSIPVTVALDSGNNDSKLGDTCAILKASDPPGYARQIVVRNEADMIVGKQTLLDSTYQPVRGSSALYCTVSFSISVPKSNFYTVFVDDEMRVQTLAGSDLPFKGDDSMLIMLASD